MTRLLAVALLPLLLAAEPLHVRIDRLLDDAAKGKPVSPPADDAELLRRAYLDLAGTIPDAKTARAFLDSKEPDKRVKLIDRLLASPEHPRRMQELFHVHLMERLGDNPHWAKYLHDSFARNRPWDEMARQMLHPRPDDAAKGATFFLSKRLENYGQNPVDYPALARDVGRMFLGKDLRCAQCHDHLFIGEYKQADFQGLFAFVQTAKLGNAAEAMVSEQAMAGKLEFQSVFAKVKHATGPRLPGMKEIAVPTFKKGEEYLKPPPGRKPAGGVPKFSPLSELSSQIASSPDFSRNIANRLWWVLMGRGIVHPLDQHHAGNPPSHPAVLDLLAKELAARKYDMRWLLREIALTRAYQRSSALPEGVTKLEPARFTTAIEKRVSPEQLLWATLEATGERQRVADAKAAAPVKGKPAASPLAAARQKFVSAFSGPVREPEEEPAPSLKSALFLLNDPLILSWLEPRPGNLIDRLGKLKDAEAAEELYLAVLTRRPDREEAEAVAKALAGKTDKVRAKALGRLAWALLASTEFNVNH